MERAVRPGSFLDTVKTVFFGALGVRRRVDHARETVRVKPVQIIAVGLLAAVVFVLTLIAIVRWVVAG